MIPSSEPTDQGVTTTQLLRARRGRKRRRNEAAQEQYEWTEASKHKDTLRTSQNGAGAPTGVDSHGGHRFKRLRISGQARLHAGDQITVNNFYGPVAELQSRLAEEARSGGGDAAVVVLAATILLVVCMETVTCFLTRLQCIITPGSLPAQIQRRTAMFEDALGRFNTIDIDFVVDWTSFHFNLTRAFRNQPGFRRVADAGYRLFDQPQYMIDPRRPPAFASVFSSGRHVRMCVHFAWTEVSHQQCPACGLLQDCRIGTETTCTKCSFLYHGHVGEMEVLDTEPTSQNTRNDSGHGRSNLRNRLLEIRRDDPAKFRRISISKQPELQTLDTKGNLCDTRAGRKKRLRADKTSSSSRNSFTLSIVSR